MTARNHSCFPHGVEHDVVIPQTRAALSTIASSTGCTSVGDG